MSAPLQGKRCLVTGGSRGLGLAVCEEFARQGARVAFTYSKSAADAEAASARIAAASGPASGAPLVFHGSVSDAAHVQAVAAELTAKWGGIDVLVNNAGVNQVLPLALIEEADWDRMMDVHAKGAFLFSQAALRSMIRQKSGKIVNIGSFASERVVEAPVHYAAAKSALRGFTEALAREVGRYGIQVNLVAPGMLTVGLAQSLPQHRLNEYLSQCPLGRLGTGEEVARFVAFLASDDCSFMTGAKLAVDGGL